MVSFRKVDLYMKDEEIARAVALAVNRGMDGYGVDTSMDYTVFYIHDVEFGRLPEGIERLNCEIRDSETGDFVKTLR